jgi:hypothetical protein
MAFGAVAGLAVALLLLAPTSNRTAAAPELIPVRATLADESSPVAGGGYLAWSQAGAVYVQRGRAAPCKISAPRTLGAPGGLFGPVLSYTENSARGGRVLLMDLTAGRKAVVVPYRDSTVIYRAGVAGDTLLYGWRQRPSDGIVLRNVGDGSERTLAFASHRSVSDAASLDLGQLSGDFAVWTRCSRSCSVYRYDVRADVAVPLPTRTGTSQYASSVTRAGTAYVLESTARTRPQLVRYGADGRRTALLSLPRGTEVACTYAASEQGRTAVYLNLYRFSGRRTVHYDIYKVIDPAS